MLVGEPITIGCRVMLRIRWAFVCALVFGGCSDDDSLSGVDGGADTGVSAGDAATASDAAVADGPSTDTGSTDTGATADGGGRSDTGNPGPDAGTMTTPGVEEIDLGTLTTNASGEAMIDFDLPPGTTSFMVTLVADPNALMIIKNLDGPTGNLVTDDTSNVTQIEMFLLGPFAAQFKSPNRVIQDTGWFASLFPNNPGVTVSGGNYQMVVTGIVPQGQQGRPYQGDVQARLLYRTEEPAASSVDLVLYFTGAGGITAESAPNDALIQDALVELGNIYGSAGISLGNVTYLEADAQYRTITVSTDGSPGAREEMFEGTAGNGPGLHFFFVDRFEAAFPGATIAGVSGGIPGPALAPGSPSSGVAVAISTAMGSAATLAHVMAHEGGHWLGLFHTSEITGTEDQHPETPSGQAGDTHLMYPAVGGGTMISDSQARVLRRNAELVAQ